MMMSFRTEQSGVKNLSIMSNRFYEIPLRQRRIGMTDALGMNNALGMIMSFRTEQSEVKNLSIMSNRY